MNQSELTISIARFSTKSKISVKERNSLKMRVLKAFEAKKLELLKEHSFKYTPATALESAETD